MALGREFISSSKVVFIGTYINVFFTFLITLVLARLLNPNVFGVMAIVSLSLSFFQVFANAGMATALIQFAHKMKGELISGALLILFLASIFLSVLFYLLAAPIQVFLGYGELASFLKIVAPILIVTVLAGALRAILISSKEFYKVNIINIVSTFISGILGIVLAFKGFGIYALINKMFIYQGCLFLIYGWVLRSRFTYHIDWNFGREFWSYTFNGLYNQVVGYSMKNLDTLLVGKFLGEIALGLYDVSFKLMRQPVNTLAKVFSPVIQPLFRNEKNEVVLVAYTRFSRFIGLIGFIISSFLIIWGDLIFLFLYGEKWVKGAPIFNVMSITIFFHLLLSGVGGIMLARGYQRVLSRSMTLSFISVAICILIGARTGDLYTLAWFYVLSVLINFIQSFYFMFKKVLKVGLITLFYRGYLSHLVVSYFSFCGLFFLLKLHPFYGIAGLEFRLIMLLVWLVVFIPIARKYKFLSEMKYIIDKVKR